jgi:hypothetical protein
MATQEKLEKYRDWVRAEVQVVQLVASLLQVAQVESQA